MKIMNPTLTLHANQSKLLDQTEISELQMNEITGIDNVISVI